MHIKNKSTLSPSIPFSFVATPAARKTITIPKPSKKRLKFLAKKSKLSINPQLKTKTLYPFLQNPSFLTTMEEENSSEKKSIMMVPEKMMEGVKKTLKNLDELKLNFDEFLSLVSNPEVLSQLPPLDRAHSLLLLSKVTSVLLSVKLRCSGVYPDHHPIKGELDRLGRYQEKLERFVELNKAPLRPSTTLNTQGAARFIEHSLPDLTPEQRKRMRAVGKGEEGTMKYSERTIQKKRKNPISDFKSVREAAEEFLQKAARELLGENDGGVKGPLGPIQAVDLDDD